MSTRQLIRTVLGALIRLARVVLNVRLAEIGSSNNLTNYPTPDGFEHLIIASAEDVERHGTFGIELLDTLQDQQSCIVTLETATGAYAGHQFYTSRPTSVDDAVKFFFPPRYVYAYAAFTPKEFRGRRLSPARWTVHRDWRHADGEQRPTIRYIELQNTASLASGNQDEGDILGYSAYLRLGSKVWCWNSPRCRRLGVGFRRVS